MLCAVAESGSITPSSHERESRMQSFFGVLTPPDAPVRGNAAAVQAPAMAEEDGVTVALTGRPFWRGRTEAPASAAMAGEVLAAYRRDGVGLLERLHGGFALAIVESGRRSAVLAIDRMGIQRLAYAEADGGIVFSTSAEAVARHLNRTPGIDRQSLLSYLFFHMVPAPDSIYAGVRKLPAATVAEFTAGRLQLSRYWNPDFVEDQPGDYPALARELHDSLRIGVSAAAPGNESGAFLSGGLDSSTVAGVLSEVVPAPARTFSIGFGFADYDELSYARIANRRFGCAGHEYEITAADIVASFASIAEAYDEPFGNSSALPALYCAKLARRHGVTHLLAGDGGDELFAGNSRYAEQEVFERYGRVPAGARWLLEGGLKLIPAALTHGVLRKAKGYVAKARTPLPDRLETWNFMRQLGMAEVLDPDFLAAVAPDGPIEHMREVYRSAPARSNVNRLLYYDWQFTLADNDLRKVEAMCELGGIAVSYPMLHPDVVEMSNRVPPGMKMPGTELRDFYKRAMQGYLPDEIIHKKKHGFGLPFGLWLQQSSELRDLVYGNLSDLKRRHIIRDGFLDRLLDLHGADDARYYGVFIWVLAMLEQWFKAHEISA
jgi:asparagine synthase (glutamine-hydrolysing)